MSDDYNTIATEDEQIHDEEASLDAGNRRWAVIAGAVVLLLGGIVVFGPEANRKRISNGELPTFELSGVSIKPEQTAAAPAAASAAPVATTAATKPVAKAAAHAAAATPATAATAEPLTPVEATAPVAAVEEAPAAAPAPSPAPEEAPRSVTMSGRVLDENGKPLAGATVFVKGTHKFASTDQNGNYSVEAPAGDNLVFGYGGYQDQEMRAAGAKSNITLIPSESGKRRRR